jgi:hypothetical protein
VNHDNEIDIATLAAMNPERLAAMSAEAAETSPCMWRRLHFELTEHKGADVAATTREWIKDLSEQTSFLDAEQISEQAREVDAIRAAIVTHVAFAAPNLAPELMWKFFELAKTIFECTSEEGWEVSCVSTKLAPT